MSPVFRPPWDPPVDKSQVGVVDSGHKSLRALAFKAFKSLPYGISRWKHNENYFLAKVIFGAKIDRFLSFRPRHPAPGGPEWPLAAPDGTHE